MILNVKTQVLRGPRKFLSFYSECSTVFNPDGSHIFLDWNSFLSLCVNNHAYVCTEEHCMHNFKFKMHYHVELPPPVCLLLFV